MIKLLTSIASNQYSYAPGEVVTLEPETEKRLVDSGQAVKVTQKVNQKADKK